MAFDISLLAAKRHAANTDKAAAMLTRSILHLELLQCFVGECGGRADVRWVTLTDENGSGFAAVTLDDPLQVNVTR